LSFALSAPFLETPLARDQSARLSAVDMETPGRVDGRTKRVRAFSKPAGKDVQDHLLAV